MDAVLMMIVLGQMKNVTQLIRYVGFHAMALIALKMNSVILSRNYVSLRVRLIWKIKNVFGLMRNVTQIEISAGKNAQKLEIVGTASFVT